MITRIVKMTFKAEESDVFLSYFNASKEQIRAMPGCLGLSLVRDQENLNIFFTVSKWERDEDLQHYRQSSLFKDTWSKVKPLFAERAVAWSTKVLYNESVFV